MPDIIGKQKRLILCQHWASQAAQQRVQSLSKEELPEKEMATYSSILAWEIPWTEEPGRLQIMGSQKIGHDLATKPSPPCQH